MLSCLLNFNTADKIGRNYLVKCSFLHLCISPCLPDSPTLMHFEDSFTPEIVSWKGWEHFSMPLTELQTLQDWSNKSSPGGEQRCAKLQPHHCTPPTIICLLGKETRGNFQILHLAFSTGITITFTKERGGMLLSEITSPIFLQRLWQCWCCQMLAPASGNGKLS